MYIVDFFRRRRTWHTIEVVVNEASGKVLERTEARMLQAGYKLLVEYRRTDDSAVYHKPSSLMTFLRGNGAQTIKVARSLKDGNRTWLIIQANKKARQDAERLAREEFRYSRNQREHISYAGKHRIHSDDHVGMR